MSSAMQWKTSLLLNIFISPVMTAQTHKSKKAKLENQYKYKDENTTIETTQLKRIKSIL